ncbi:hypothetical protein LTR60_005795, partial [Cryomyces antarcticus]
MQNTPGETSATTERADDPMVAQDAAAEAHTKALDHRTVADSRRFLEEEEQLHTEQHKIAQELA